MRIAIAGNIGAGKTSLTKQLSKSLKYKPYYEDVIANPYLDDFYNHMERWSFNLQIYFLNSRFKQLVTIDSIKENVIQDRTIYEDAFIFAPNLNAMGLMTQRDYDNYSALRNAIAPSAIFFAISAILAFPTSFLETDKFLIKTKIKAIIPAAGIRYM